jgi:hypothetical protein
VFVEVGLKLLFCFFRVSHKLRTRPEYQSADIAIGKAGRSPDESGYLEIPVWHATLFHGGTAA